MVSSAEVILEAARLGRSKDRSKPHIPLGELQDLCLRFWKGISTLAAVHELSVDEVPIVVQSGSNTAMDEKTSL